MRAEFEELAEKAKKIVAEGKDSEEFEQLKAAAATLGEEAAVFVRKYPLQSVLGAAVAGFLLGSSWGRKK